ncbi:MAG: carboxypeptidase-like regulatory domain-containing protein, partial [Gemmatimonadales bacterium]
MSGPFPDKVKTLARCGSAALAVLLLAAPATPQIISGRAVDADSGEPVDGVLITLLDRLGATRADVVTDSAGNFIIEVPTPGTYALRAARLGYHTARTRPIEIGEDEAVELELRLDVRPVELEELAVVVRRRENLRERDLREYRERIERYGRSHVGSQRIFAREDLEGWEAFDVEHALRYLSPGWRRIGQRWNVYGQPCSPKVFLDGRPIRQELDSVLKQIPVWDVEGIEFYSGAGPVETRFWDADGCGVVLVWTRPFVGGERRAYLGVLTGAIEGEQVGTARYFRGFHTEGRFEVDKAVAPVVFLHGEPLPCLSSTAQVQTVTVDSLWPYRPPARHEPDFLVTAQPARSSEGAAGTLFWAGELDIERVAGREVTLDSVAQALIEDATRWLWDDAVAQLPEDERDLEMRIERDDVRAFGSDLVVVQRYPVIDGDDRRGWFFLVYSPLAGRVLHGTFSHPEWHPDATFTAIRPYLYFRIEGDERLYALA